MQIIGEMYIKCGLVLLKINGLQLSNLVLVVASQKTLVSAVQKWKMVFYTIKLKTPMDNIVCHSKMHMCAHYGKKNYAMHVAITLVICPKTHESSYKVAHFREYFFKILAISQVCYFS
jgi:hypothetical protein